MEKVEEKYHLKDFWDFGLKQFRSAIFGITIILSLIVTTFVKIPHLARYDTLLICVIVIQMILLVSKYERAYDLIPIMVFHVLGMILEIFKVKHGSWSYPDAGLFKIMDVPLYSAFMYSAIGSYIVRAIKEFDLEAINWPHWLMSVGISILIYLNFFSGTFGFDFRNIFYLFILMIFWKTKFTFVLRTKRYQMPAILSFFLIGLFIYLAENIGSYFSAWTYSYQLKAWQFVDLGKISSWTLLIIVSIIIVIELQRYFSKNIEVKNIIKS
ncbi:DUF817 domain-containing protein [Lactococcus lactis]|uniref:DUF817 domain-containing protein n=1 Tax=Lactococcus lactis TaxID=1358 RepID=UPI001F53077F|nr:DUF817 domain-containing protein [Lactococcus lactis]MCI1071583.1 DUF817 domain-containing protein [Lactococcus lactis]MCT1193829.1 DUF817 domain-containing protein [Lactococcus lactis]